MLQAETVSDAIVKWKRFGHWICSLLYFIQVSTVGAYEIKSSPFSASSKLILWQNMNLEIVRQ